MTIVIFFIVSLKSRSAFYSGTIYRAAWKIPCPEVFSLPELSVCGGI
jgi:hypothetical protein